jgi:CRISPR-associated endonuclease/helicase Cas3
MVVDINKLKSHPNKALLTHVNGVIKGTKSLSSSNIAELAAIFHDLGKMNFGFQIKVYPTVEQDLGIKVTEADRKYSHHAYLSAYAFLCYYLKNGADLEKHFGKGFSKNELLALVIIIAKHHGNLPNFLSVNVHDEKEQVLNKDEANRLFEYLEQSTIPFDEFPRLFNLPNNSYSDLLSDNKAKNFFKNFHLDIKSHSNYLKFYQETQFSFASLIQSDKKDAGYIEIDDKRNIENFCSQYSSSFNNYLKTLEPYQDKPLNQLRTKIRNEVTFNISNFLKNDNTRIFDLTAPTGSGKTLSLLSLADEIIKQKGNLRVMYCLPFLSITEQVEKEVLEIFKGQSKFVQRIDSKSINEDIQRLQKELDRNPSESKFKELGTKQFQENIFEYPFIITTFVRFFEAFVKNRNAGLLKLPSFSNCIFLIDEIQALPPRLYGFFVGYLDAFCKRFNSYAVISTATMPDFELPTDEIKSFFPDYQVPPKLLSSTYFDNELFNRYIIEHQKDGIGISTLAQKLIDENQSVLCIVNTIDDSKDLFEELSESLQPHEICLLNTHFTPNDRKYKIEYAKLRLKSNKRIILISTQLIEAGVDIDFPVLYRDMAIIPSIVQSAGRCNRNGDLKENGEKIKGRVIVFNLYKQEKARASLIYRGKDRKLLTSTKKVLIDKFYEENKLFKHQKYYFKFIRENLMFGEHEQNDGKDKLDFIELIKEAMFATLGKFKLIDDEYYGEAYRIYIPENNKDDAFDKLEKIVKVLDNLQERNWNIIGKLKGEINTLLKEMSSQVVQVRLKKNDIKPDFRSEEVRGLVLLDIEGYDEVEGINLSVDNQFI